MHDRGVSTVVGYVLTLGIVALLVSSLMGGFVPLVTNQQQRTATSTMMVFGNDIAGDIDSADRLVTRTGGNGTVELRTRLPDRVAGNRYEIEITSSTVNANTYAHDIRLRTTDLEASAFVRVRTQWPVKTPSGGPIDGGDLVIVFDDATDSLVIRNV